MTVVKTTATEIKNNFGRYLNMVSAGKEVIVMKNGKEVGRFIPKDAVVSYLTDSLAGILKPDISLEEAKDTILDEKYKIID